MGRRRHSPEPSFTAVVRGELARLPVQKGSERRAELSALLHTLGEVHFGDEAPPLQLVTYSAALARRVFRHLKAEFGVTAHILVRRGRAPRAPNQYRLRILDNQCVGRMLVELGVFDEQGRRRPDVPVFLRRTQATRAAYLRGLFLATGYVNPPHRGYHLELVLRDEAYAHACRALLAESQLRARVVRRRDGHALYLRGGDQVARFLSLTGAHAATLHFEDTRVYRDVRGRVNRLINAETANLEKAVVAALRQVSDIQRLADERGLDGLPASLREIARARLEHPELSLRELGQLLTPPLSKSAVAHRMRRIQALARQQDARLGLAAGERTGKGIHSQGPE